MMCLMDRDWARLGAALRAAREDLGLEQQQVAEQIGVGRGALRNVEIGDVSRITPTVRTYARIVGWTDASVDEVLAGGSPTPKQLDDVTETATVEGVAPEELPLRIKAALAAGSLLDAQVIDLPSAEGEEAEAQMIVIVKGRGDATPEQIRKALLQWERTEAQLKRSGGQ